MTNRAIMDKSMSELDFARAVVDLALSCGWKVRQEPPWRASCRKDDSAKGFPDLVLVDSARVLFVELKRQRGRLSGRQEEWKSALEHAARWNQYVEYHIWRPSDWEAIEARLRA